MCSRGAYKYRDDESGEMDRICRSTIVSAATVFLLSLGILRVAVAQQSPAPTDATNAVDAANAQQAPGMLVLPTVRILRLIDEQPEVSIELKRLLAQRLRAQGFAIEED